MKEDIRIFKSYLRLLLNDLHNIEELLKREEYEKAKKSLESLILDTQKGIDDQ